LKEIKYFGVLLTIFRLKTEQKKLR